MESSDDSPLREAVSVQVSKPASLLRQGSFDVGMRKPLRLREAENELLPKVHVSLDATITNIDCPRKQFEVICFIRFCIPTDHPGTKKLMVSFGEKEEDQVTFEALSVIDDDRHPDEWLYDIKIVESPRDRCYLPVNSKYMFFNSLDETVIYSDVFIERRKNRIALNFRVKATLGQSFDLSDYPFDRQYLGIKLNHRNQYYSFCYDKESAKEVIPTECGFMLSPFRCRPAFSVGTYKLIAVFVDLAPPEEFLTNNETEYKLGKPLYYAVVERDSLYHYSTFVVPLSLTMISALLILITNPVTDFDSRTNLIETLIIGLIGLKYVLVNSLPEGHHETLLDESMRNSFILTLIIGLETGAVYFFYPDQTYSVPYIEETVRPLDLVLAIVVVSFVAFLQFQYLISRAGPVSMTMDVVLCRIVNCGCWKTRGGLFLNTVLTICWNQAMKCDPFQCMRPERPIIKPWVQNDSMTPQLRELQYEFFGREANNLIVAHESVGVKERDKGVFEGRPNPQSNDIQRSGTNRSSTKP